MACFPFAACSGLSFPAPAIIENPPKMKKKSKTIPAKAKDIWRMIETSDPTFLSSVRGALGPIPKNPFSMSTANLFTI